MKSIRKLATVGFVLASFAAVPTAMAGVPQTKADHLAVVEKYEKLASDQEAITKEHTEMKKDYRANQAMLPKQAREKSLAEMDEHCGAIVSEAKKLADEYRAVAQWHKVRATEVEK